MFYLTLPSNSSMEYYPDNSASHYFTKLPQAINLTGEYEVGLCEIQFSNTYFNVRDRDCYFRYVEPEKEEDREKPTPTMVIVPGGLYESNEYFIHTLNTLVSKKLSNRPNGKHKVKFYYNKASKKVAVSVYEDGGLLHMSSSLQRILGLNLQVLSGAGRYEGDFIMDLNEDFKSVYVYCDLVSARQVGDTMAPLLRIVPMVDKKKEVVHRIFEKPHYIPLSRFQFNSTEILLMTDTGKTIAFGSGSTIVTLHFRRKRPEHY